MKDETRGMSITDVWLKSKKNLWLKSKLYLFITGDNHESKKSKDITNNVVDDEII